MGKIRRFLVIFVSLFMIAITGNAHAEGYTCDDIKQYTSCNAGYYLNGTGPGNSCSPCPTAYPNSDAGNSSGITACYSNTKQRAWSGSTPAKPDNCASVTYSAQPGSCDYVAYSNSSGTGDGTIKSGCSTNNTARTITSVTANANSYVDGTSCKTCTSFNSSYPKSDGGSISSAYCYKEVTKTGSQVNGSTPTNCNSVTEWNSCTPGTCTYKDYYSATDTTCTPTDCTKTAKTTTGKSGYYGYTNGSGAACGKCSDANSTYPLSDTGATNASYCYRNQTKTGSQLEPSAPATPTNCASKTYTTNACTPGTCTWKDYNGATDTTCTPTDCTKTATITSVTANANSYVDGTSCKTCTSFNSSYPKSDGGSISSAYCYKEVTKTGSQVNGSTPTNCNSVTEWNSCTPGTCTYKDYYSATDTTCTPTDCTKTVASVTASVNSYVDGTSCKTCPTTHPISTGGAIARNACYRNCVASDITNASTIKNSTSTWGVTVDNLKYCTVTKCNSGFYISDNVCVTIPVGGELCADGTSLCCEDGYTKNAAGDACIANKYTVKYACGTGTGTAPTSNEATFNSSYTPKDNTCVEPAGHQFAGWSVSGTSDTKTAGASFTWKYLEGKTFTAIWDAIDSYSATYSCGTGSGTAPARDTNLEYGKSYTVKANTCSKPGYTFTGWSDGSKTVQPGSITWNYTSSPTFTAQWSANTFKIAYAEGATGATGSAPTAPVSCTYDGTCTAPANTYTNGTSKFTGWKCTGGGTSCDGDIIAAGGSIKNATTTNNATITLTAQWAAAGTSDGCAACAAGTGATCTLTAPNGVCTYTTSCKTGYNNIQNNGKYNPSCTAITYTISYTLNGGTNATSGVPTSYTYGVGATITGKPSRTGYLFAGWCTESALTNCFMTQTISTTSTGNKTFYAKWSDCPEHATCPGDSPDVPKCDTNYDWDPVNKVCVQGALECVAGKYYPGTGETMLDCPAGRGWYCPGTGKAAIGTGTAGCYVACPKSKNNGTLTTSSARATSASACIETLVDVDIFDQNDSKIKNGTADKRCGYTSGTDGNAIYAQDCSYTVKSCIGGYYVPIKEGNSKQGYCAPVDKGYYRAAGACNTNWTNAENDNCMQKACPTPGTTAGTKSEQITQCLIECTQSEAIKDASGKTIGNRTAVNKPMNYDTTTKTYPVCTYTATCATGYEPQNQNTATATCVPSVYTIKLNINYTGGTNQSDIYAKYNTGWYSNAAATTSIPKITVPTRANYDFAGYTNADGDTVIKADGTFVNAKPTFTADTELKAVWHGIPITCVAGKYYTGVGTLMADCLSGTYCPGNVAGNTAYQGAEGCFVRCPTSAKGGTLSSESGATAQTQCVETLTNVTISHGTADTSCKYTSGVNGSAVYEQNCNATVKSCDGGYYVPIKEGNSKQGYCAATEKGYYRPAGICNANPTTDNDTCMQIKCPGNGTTAGTATADKSRCFVECKAIDIMSDAGAKIGQKNPVDAQQFITSNDTYPACKYNAQCSDGYVPQPANSDAGTESPTCVVGAGWSITYYEYANGEGYTLSGNVIFNFTVETANRTLPTASKTGYVFDGWYEQANLSGSRITSIPANRMSAMTLYPKWTPRVYPVTARDAKHGTPDIVIYLKYGEGWYSDAVATGTKLTKFPSIPNGSGDTFGGYEYTDGTEVVNASGNFNVNKLTPSDDMVITAIWQTAPIKCPAGKYYPGTGDETNCQPCKNGYYCTGESTCSSNNGKVCGLSTCPDFVIGALNISSDAGAANVTQCYKSNVAYTSDAKHVTAGTAKCPANASLQYVYDATKCTNYNVTKCVAGYYHATTTAADACEAVGKGWYSDGTGTDRTQCEQGTIHTYTADGQEPIISTARGTTTGTTSTRATDCYLENMPFGSSAIHGKGTQTCYYDGFVYNTNDESRPCTTKVIRYCDAGYWRKNASDEVCIEAGEDHYSLPGVLTNAPCPERTDATGVLKHGETTQTTDGSGKVKNAQTPEACVLRVPYEVTNGTGTQLCSYNEASVNPTTQEQGQYDKNCEDKTITSCDGGYYRPVTGGIYATDKCVAVGNNFYRPQSTCQVNTTTGEDTCMRIACPDSGLTSGTTSDVVTDCYKTVSYTSTDNHVATGTQVCNANTSEVYNDKCRDYNVTKCVAGYWRATSTAANACEAVGTGWWSDGTGTGRTQCESGTVHVYDVEGADPDITTVRGTTETTTSTASTACYLPNVPYAPTNGHGKGIQKCFYNGFTYTDKCANESIKYCDAGYWRESTSAKVCIPAGADNYSITGAVERNACPARTDANGVVKNGETPKRESTVSGKLETATTSQDCVLRVPYTVPHGTGTYLCSFNEASVNQTTGEAGQYDLNCKDKIITACVGGYYRPMVSGIPAIDACIAVGYGYYSPNPELERTSCPSGQTTKTQTSDSANACYACPAGSVCEPCDGDDCTGAGEKTCSSLTNGQYPYSDAGTTSVSKCYRDCGLATNAATMKGRDYYGSDVPDTCAVATCRAGYHYDNGQCVECPEGSFCGGCSGPDCSDCTGTNCGTDTKSCATVGAGADKGKWPYSIKGAKSEKDCYQKCEAYPISGGMAVPVNDKEFYDNKCEFKGKSDNGNDCDIVDGACVETSCRNIYEMVNGTCVPCNREHALSYLPNGNCMVASCTTGYHPNGQYCEENVKECPAANAIRASQTWDTKLNSFSVCIVEECESGYHIASNACVPDEQVCAVDHGVGIKEWNHQTNTWDKCVATLCDAGYTNDPSQTNDHSAQCGVCANKFSILGEVAASTYISGCEIAACLYQGEKYNLENNECVPICEAEQDETGTRHWDDKRKKCVRECNPGYTQW
ncbi:MAG: InlB B-repeat-containing protein [Muribaculaceae bacterium]|nr:InlB B-repeat-containing protein [Muribaculaceae bacterium]